MKDSSLAVLPSYRHMHVGSILTTEMFKFVEGKPQTSQIYVSAFVTAINFYRVMRFLPTKGNSRAKKKFVDMLKTGEGLETMFWQKDHAEYDVLQEAKTLARLDSRFKNVKPQAIEAFRAHLPQLRKLVATGHDVADLLIRALLTQSKPVASAEKALHEPIFSVGKVKHNSPRPRFNMEDSLRRGSELDRLHQLKLNVT